MTYASELKLYFFHTFGCGETMDCRKLTQTQPFSLIPVTNTRRDISKTKTYFLRTFILTLNSLVNKQGGIILKASMLVY